MAYGLLVNGSPGVILARWFAAVGKPRNLSVIASSVSNSECRFKCCFHIFLEKRCPHSVKSDFTDAEICFGLGLSEESPLFRNSEPVLEKWVMQKSEFPNLECMRIVNFSWADNFSK